MMLLKDEMECMDGLKMSTAFTLLRNGQSVGQTDNSTLHEAAMNGIHGNGVCDFTWSIH